VISVAGLRLFQVRARYRRCAQIPCVGSAGGDLLCWRVEFLGGLENSWTAAWPSVLRRDVKQNLIQYFGFPLYKKFRIIALVSQVNFFNLPSMCGRVTFRCHSCKSIHVKVNVQVKFTLEQATKAQRGSRDIALLFL